MGLAGTYFFMVACYLIAVLLLLRMPSGVPQAVGEYVSPYRALVDGLSYVRRHSVLPVLLLMGFVPIVLGMPYRQFFPVFAEEVYGVGSAGLGAMGVVMSAGALAGSLLVASLTQTSRRAMMQLAGGVGFGLSLILFAAAPALVLGLLALLLVGITANGYWALNNTMVLGATDREYYGRVMSVYMLSWSLMPFATLPESALVDRVGVQTLVAGVGVLLMAMLVLIAVLLPGYRRLREEEAARILAAD